MSMMRKRTRMINTKRTFSINRMHSACKSTTQLHKDAKIKCLEINSVTDSEQILSDSDSVQCPQLNPLLLHNLVVALSLKMTRRESQCLNCRSEVDSKDWHT
jgi:hypothetical protein